MQPRLAVLEGLPALVCSFRAFQARNQGGSLMWEDWVDIIRQVERISAAACFIFLVMSAVSAVVVAIAIAISICISQLPSSMVYRWWFESPLILVEIKTHPYIMFSPFVISQRSQKIRKPLVLDTIQQGLSNGATPISIFPLFTELLTLKPHFKLNHNIWLRHCGSRTGT
jgi:hypothetical protein